MCGRPGQNRTGFSIRVGRNGSHVERVPAPRTLLLWECQNRAHIHAPQERGGKYQVRKWHLGGLSWGRTRKLYLENRRGVALLQGDRRACEGYRTLRFAAGAFTWGWVSACGGRGVSMSSRIRSGPNPSRVRKFGSYSSPRCRPGPENARRLVPAGGCSVGPKLRRSKRG